MTSRRKIEKIAIANRGEVAVRIIRACQELGLETVLLHSEADAGGWPARLADEAVCIGPAAVSGSYLSIDANIQAALSRGADAVHPGFGFLSENAAFAQACAENGLVFVGPSPESIRLFGDKISAKRLVMGAGAQVIPGYDGDDQVIARLIQEAGNIGYPVIAKAAGGGGGRGLKIIREPGEARTQIEAAQREGESAFGSKKVFLEKYLGAAKHIEVQIFGDAGGRVHQLGVRDCSVQRRHQKMIEESPAADLSSELTARISAAAAGIATMARYTSAGTVEFLVEDGNFYFMEMNTRLQVEHPVTEMVYGVDLVKAQLLTAMGQAVDWNGLQPRGHAIECRLYAENPFTGGIPSTGRITGLRWPQGPGRRFETGVEQGDSVTSHYDPMIAKVVVWDETRARAIQKMKCTLRDVVIFGVHTNIPLLQEILRHPDFELGVMTTQFFAEHFTGPLPAYSFSKSENEFLARLRTMVAPGGITEGGGPGQASRTQPLDSLLEMMMQELVVEIEGKQERVWVRRERGALWVHFRGRTHMLAEEESVVRKGRGAGATHPGRIVSPMPGKVIKVLAVKGKTVSPGEVLVILEAMKMEYTLTADIAGAVQVVTCSAGDQVALGKLLVEIAGGTVVSGDSGLGRGGNGGDGGGTG